MGNLEGVRQEYEDEDIASKSCCTLWCLINGGVQIVGGDGNFPKI